MRRQVGRAAHVGSKCCHQAAGPKSRGKAKEEVKLKSDDGTRDRELFGWRGVSC